MAKFNDDLFFRNIRYGNYVRSCKIIKVEPISKEEFIAMTEKESKMLYLKILSEDVRQSKKLK